jgi:hypothetical protein
VPREPLPPPLPPETRTVGQLVAESVHLYGQTFWPSVATGLSIAIVNQLPILVGVAASPFLLTASYVGACLVVTSAHPDRRALATAYTAGVLAYVPFAFSFLVLGFALLGVAWLAFVGLSVPAAVVEGRDLRRALARGVELGRSDYVHALGSLATFAIVYFLVRLLLVLLLVNLGDAAERVAIFLADLVLAPVVFLGAALLYYDQAARVKKAAAAS